MKYIKPNWYAINKAISEGNLKELRAEEFQIKKKIQEKVDAYYKDKREREALDKIAALKTLPVGGIIYYTGRSNDIKFGAEGVKVKDGRTRMEIDFSGKHWCVYYTNIKLQKITSEEKTSRVVTDRITNMLNERL